MTDTISSNKGYKQSMLLVLIMTIIQLTINVFLPTQWNDNWLQGNGFKVSAGLERWDIEVGIHKTIPAFASRVFTTSILDFFKDTLGIEYLFTYMTISTLAYFLCGVMLIVISKHLKFSPLMTTLSVCLFYLNFANLFHQMRPIYTYDDPFQLLFILIGTYAVLKENLLGIITMGFLANYVRESAVFMFPAWICLSWFQKKSIKWTGSVIAVLFLTGILYLIANHYTQIAMKVLEANKEYMKTTRLDHYKYNFKSFSHIVISISSVLNMLLFPIGVIFIHKKKLFKEYKEWVYPFFIVLILNTPIVLLLTFAHESRLFILPMIFMWPLYGKLLLPWLKNIRNDKKVFSFFIMGCSSLILFIAITIIMRCLNVYARPFHIMAIFFFLVSNYIYTHNSKIKHKEEIILA